MRSVGLLCFAAASALRAGPTGLRPAPQFSTCAAPAGRSPIPAMTAQTAAAAACQDPHPSLLARVPPIALRTVARTTAALALALTAPAMAFASTGAEHLHLGQKVALYFRTSGLPDWAILTLISATPAIELRGGVPVGAWMGLSPATTFVLCLLGNMAPIAPMLLALRSDAFKRLAAPLLSRAEKKLAGLPTGQSRTLALALFVGVPAPGTGAWTGAIIAYLLDMPFATAMASIFSGVVLAGVIMTILTLAGKAGALVALGVLLAGGIGAILNASDKETKGKQQDEE